MTWLQISISLGEFVLAMTLVVVALYASLRIYTRLTRDKIDLLGELKSGNVAAGIVVTALMVTPAWIVLKAIEPTTHLLRIAVLTDQGVLSAFTVVGTAVVHLFFGFTMALLSVWFAVWLFDRFTGIIDEWEQVKKGNVAVALLLAGVIFLVALFMQHSVAQLSRSMIPDLPLGEVRGLDWHPGRPDLDDLSLVLVVERRLGFVGCEGYGPNVEVFTVLRAARDDTLRPSHELRGAAVINDALEPREGE